MKINRWRVLVLCLGAALPIGLSPPASANGSGSLSESAGQDFNPSATVVAGVEVANTHDGSSTSTDIISASLDAVIVGGQKRLRATIVVDGTVPFEGLGLPTDFDGPDSSFVGGSYMVMFQNKDKMTNGDNPDTGCARVPTGRVRDQGGHWADGYHQYIGLSVTYDTAGIGWSHSPRIGEYDPSPDGAFFFTDLESETAMAGKFSSWVMHSGGNSTIVVEVASIVERADALCVGGVHKEDIAAEAADNRKGAYPSGTFAVPSGYTWNGDRIANVSALTTADQTVTLHEAIPLSVIPGQSDVKAIGGFIYFADNTNQASNGQVVYSGGEAGVSDTLGDGPTCPTPTFGGTVPNPLWAANQNQPCQIDDDAVGNTLLSEFRPAGHDFVVDFT